MRKIILAIKLLWIGRKLEKSRRRLENLYMTNEPNDSRRMRSARNNFNRLCTLWEKLEADYNGD